MCVECGCDLPAKGERTKGRDDQKVEAGETEASNA